MSWRPFTAAFTIVGLCSLFAGCQGPSNASFVLSDLPTEGHWLTVVELNDEESFVSASRLVPVGEAETLAVLSDYDGGALFDVNVFEESRLIALGFDPLDEVMLGEAPIFASGLERRLPSPSLAVRFDEDGLQQEDPRAWPLAVSWAACRDLVGEGAVVSLDCEKIRCEARVTQDGCQLSMHAPSCQLDLEAEVVADELQFEESRGLGHCVGIEPARGGLWSASCEGGELEPSCRIDVFAKDAPSRLERLHIAFPHEPLFESILDAGFEQAIPVTKAAPEPVVGRPVPGYLTGAFVSGDHLVVSRNTSPSVEGDALGFGCPDHRRGTFEIVMLDSGEWVSTTTVPPCITQLVVEPARSMTPDSVVVLLGTNPRSLQRLYPDGAPLGPAVPIPDLDGRYIWLQMIGPTALGKLYVTGSLPVRAPTDPIPEIPESLVFEIDALTLTTERRLAETHSQIQVIRLLDDERPVFVTGGDTDAIRDLRTGELIADIRGACRYQVIPNDFARTSPSAPLVVTADGDDAPTQLVLSGASLESCRGAAFPWFFAAGSTVTAWPEDPSLYLSSVVQILGPPTLRRAAVALFDPVAGRYVGGHLEIGGGPATYPTTDPNGAIWLLMPWSDELVRVRPRSGVTIPR